MSSEPLPLKKTIAFVSSMPLENKRNWSGTMFQMYQSLQKQGFEVLWIPLPEFSEKEQNIFSKIQQTHEKVFGRTFNKYHFFLKSWMASRKLKKALKNQKFDLLFVPTYAESIAFLNINQPIIYLNDATFHQLFGYYPAFCGLGFLSKITTCYLEKRALKVAHHCIFSSNWASNHARDFYGIDAKKTTTVKFGANADVPSHFIEKKEKHKPITFLFLAVDWKRKGGDIAHKAIEILYKKGHHVQLQIIGCNPDINDEFTSIIPFLNKNIESEKKQIEAHLLQSDFLFLPTRADCTPISFAEAAGYGLPIISSDTGGVSAMVENGKTGILLPIEAKAEQYAIEIEKLLDSPKNIITRLEKNSRKKYETELNWEKWGENINTIIKNLIP